MSELYIVVNNRDEKQIYNDVYFDSIRDRFSADTTQLLNADDLKHPTDERRLIFVDEWITLLGTIYPEVQTQIDSAITRDAARDLGWFASDFEA